ncbi:MAG: ribulose-phosphate 3-epimerase [Planctomycetia bacterium]|nr:ribulose-phosphate 3-epimerase [Planctomycetia bacterium]
MLSREKFMNLPASSAVIFPSLLACDFANLLRDIRSVEDAGAEVLHLDIMDGHFVPNLSMGIPIVESVRKITDLVLDVHLMLSEPEKYIQSFRKAGADVLTFHVEAVADQEISGKNFSRNGCKNEDICDETCAIIEKTSGLLEKIRELGAASGLAIIPPTEVEVLAHWTELCDNILIMSVMPGFGGQSFHKSALSKLQWLTQNMPEKVRRSVDGGVNENTLDACVNAGATGLVMGTAIFKNPDRKQQMEIFQKQIRESCSASDVL